MYVHVGCKNRSTVRVSSLRGRDARFGDARDNRPQDTCEYLITILRIFHTEIEACALHKTVSLYFLEAQIIRTRHLCKQSILPD
jgi:hypothetical protein